MEAVEHRPGSVEPSPSTDSDDTSHRVRILYVAGWGRSGSTLLTRLLGANDRMVPVGEIKFLWSRGLIENRTCGCGRRVMDCDFWMEVVETGLGGLDDRAIASFAEAEARTRTRHVPSLLLPGSMERFAPDLDEYRQALGRLYSAIADRSGSDIVVDSSKFPAYLLLLQQIPELDVRVVHMVRDPWAVAFSWAMDKPDTDTGTGTSMPRLHPATTSVYWSMWNAAIGRICDLGDTPRLVVRYEDLVAEPRRRVEQVLDWAGVPSSADGFVDLRRVSLERSHTVSGNPGRHDAGIVDVVPDDRWRSAMPSRHKRLVWALTRPVRARYGYAT